MSKTINDLFREIIALNEGGESVAYKFSDPDGLRSGKSGWSFGVVQWDTQNNDLALACLKDCGFTGKEIDGIVKQTVDVAPLAKRLKDHADVIAEYDMRQLQYCLNKAGQFAEHYGVPLFDTAALLMLADTINQYGSIGETTAAKLTALGRPVTAQDVLDVKLTWKYATQTKNGRADTIRRHDNVMKVLA